MIRSWEAMEREPQRTPGAGRGGAAGLVLLGIASVQLGSALATTLFDDVGPGGAVFLRTLFAAIVLLALWRPIRSAIDAPVARSIVLFGVVLAGMNLCFFQALERLPLGIAVTFEFTGPLAVAVLSSRRRLDVLWAALAAGGILLFAPDVGEGLDPVGVAFALAAGGFWALYILLAARVGRGPAGLGGLSAAMVVAAVLLVPVGLGDGGADLIAPGILLAGLGVALLSSAIPYALELQALRRLPAGTFGVLLSLEPAAAAAIGAIALDQELAGRELLAIALVVVASIGALRTSEELNVPEA
jgi:inner membrane transporter RhtA